MYGSSDIKINKKLTLSMSFFFICQVVFHSSSFAAEEMLVENNTMPQASSQQNNPSEDETLFSLGSYDVGESLKAVGGQIKDKIVEKAGSAKDKVKEKTKELSAKAKEITKAVKENAPWGDIMKKLARTGLAGLGGCAKGALMAVPGAVLLAAPTLGGSAVDLALACGAGFVKKAGPRAVKLIVESVKTTADLVILDNAIKANEADIGKLMQALQDAHDFIHENLDTLDENVINVVNKAIASTSSVISDLKEAIPPMKQAYAEAQQAFKDKKIK
jgi:hypothetical protein